MQVPLAPLPGPITSLLMPGQLSDLEAASSRAVAWAAVLTGPAQEARRGVHRARRLAARPANLAGQPGAVRRTVMRSRTREGTSANAATGALGPALAGGGPAAQALTELAAQPVKIAQNPGAGQPPGIRHEEGSTGVFETPLRGRHAQQRPGMCAGEPKPRCRVLPVADQLNNLIAEVRGAGTHQIPVPPPSVPPHCLLPQ